MDEIKKLSLLPRSEPFYHAGGSVGCLVIHGFTGAPQEVRELGSELAAAGYTVCGPRLTHHGTDPADMTRSLWQDWYFSALDGYHFLRANCEQVVVVGLSMGGATALLMAAWEEVTAVVALAAPIQLKEDPRLPYTRQLATVYPYDPPLDPEWRENFDPNGRISYPVNPTYAVSQLNAYLPHVTVNLPHISVPTLLMHAVDDETVPPINLTEIYRRLETDVKQKIVLDQGGHVLTEGPEKERVFAEVKMFLQQHAPLTVNN